jgi:hypothetical protein
LRSPFHKIYQLTTNNRSNTASGLFFSSQDGFRCIFAIPKNPSPTIFTGTFDEALPQFNTPNVTLVYDDVKDLTGSYAIQAGSTVRPNVVSPKKIDLILKNEAGKEVRILATISQSVGTASEASPVTGKGSWD